MAEDKELFGYEEEDIITLEYDDGVEEECGILGVFDALGKEYMALNPLDITTSEVLRFVQGYSKVLSSQIIQGQAEIMEFIATPGTKVIDKPLRSLDLPGGMLFAAIHRKGKVIIPGGNDVIKPGDRVTMIYLLSEISVIEGLISQVSKMRLKLFRK